MIRLNTGRQFIQFYEIYVSIDIYINNLIISPLYIQKHNFFDIG
jgi:hypothetical protein